MNFNKFTKRSLEAVEAAQSLANRYSNQTVDQQHLMAALCAQEDGLILEMLTSLGLDAKTVRGVAENEVDKLPKVSGSAAKDGMYVSSELNRALSEAEATAEKMQDSYISVEHLLLGLLDAPNDAMKKLFKTFSIDKEKILKAMQEIRGNQQVTSQDPEGTYNALKKYGQDLVEMAKQNKLDPVIGRDNEIRNVIRILSRKTKNNPVLIGEPGVGKTAVVEGLAQ